MTPQRQTLTKTYLKQAITELLAQGSFDRISVSAICKKAGINRSTFYLHYDDKYDMMTAFKQELIEHLQQIMVITPEDTETALFNCLTYLKADIDFLTCIRREPAFDFQQSVEDFLASLFLATPHFDQTIADHYQIPSYYAREVYFASIQRIISLWVDDKAQTPIDDLVKIILTL